MAAIRRTMGMGLVAAVAIAGGIALGAPSQAASGVTVTWTVDSEWSNGYQVSAKVKNDSGKALNPWQVSFTTANTVSSIWDATSAAISGGFKVSGPSWSKSLANGASASFGLVVNKVGGAALTPSGCAVSATTCTIAGGASASPTPTSPTPTQSTSPSASPTQSTSPTPTQSTSPTPTQSTSPSASPTQTGAPEGPANLPTPVRFTPTSTAAGTLTYHTALPYPTGPSDQMSLSSNYTDLIISNYVGGALLGQLLKAKDPSLAMDKDYVYGALFAQLLQENINTTGYSNATDWINPTAAERNQLLAPGQGGPYQINDYSKRLENPTGIGLVNFVALQKGLGYTVEAQDSGAQTASTGPASLDQKYFGPMAAAYFHLNDYNRIVMNNAESWGPQYAYYNACKANLDSAASGQAPFNNYDMILNAAYNAGTYSTILKDYYRICAGQFGTGAEADQVKSIGDYSLSDAAYRAAIGTNESAGSTFILYPRQVRLYLDQMYNKATFGSSAIRGDTSINLSASDIATVFANSMGTLAYLDGSGGYSYVAPADSAAAFSAALTSGGLNTGSRLDISKAPDRAKFFTLLETGIANLGSRLGTDFGAVTQTTIGGASSTPTPTASSTPTPTATVTSSPTPTPSETPTETPTPTPTPTVTDGVALNFAVDSDWGSGRTVTATVRNSGTAAVSSWSVQFAWPSAISPWGGVGSYSGGTQMVANEAWNGALAAGASTTFGFNDSSASMPAPPSCVASVDGHPVTCAINGATSSPTPTPTSTVTATPTPTVTSSPTATPTATSSPTPTPTSTPTPNPAASPAPPAGKKSIGYYPSWGTYGRDYQVADIPAGQLSHINYAFANVVGGQCAVGDTYADTDKAFAGDSWEPGAKRGNFNQLTKLKAAHPGLKTLISVGGWTWSGGFSAAAATDASRDAFANSCVAFMKQWGFDGIDIDWEYPVGGGLTGGTPADKTNYTKLLAALRSKLDAQAVADGATHYLLTVAAPAGGSNIANQEVANVAATVDWVNLMSYDFHGAWDSQTGHNAPLHAAAGDPGPAGLTVDAGVNAWLNGGTPAAKLVVGVPFYGRGWSQVASGANNGLYQSASATPPGTWEAGVFDYADLANNYVDKNGFTRHWDDAAKVPYLWNATSQTFITYDDPQSIAEKARYIRDRGLGGGMFWDLSSDTGDCALLDSLNANMG